MKSDSRFTNLIYGCLLVLQVIAWRLPFLGVHLTSDPSGFAYIARGILANRVPYRDFFDHKAPIIYYMGAFFTYLFKDAAIGFWMMEVFYVSVTVCVVYVMIRRVLSPTIALILGSLYILFSNVCIFYYLTPGFVEYPAAMFTVLAYFFTLYSKCKRWHLCAGAAIWLAIMSQQTALIVCVPIMVYLLLTKQYRQLTFQSLCIVVFTAAFCVWYFAIGALEDFYYCVFTFNRFYVKANPTTIDLNRLPCILYLVSPLPLLLYLSPQAVRRSTDFLFLFSWLLAAITSLVLSGMRLYAHYFVILAAPLVVSIAYGWAAMPGSKRNIRNVIVIACCSGVLLTQLANIATKDYFKRIASIMRMTSKEEFDNPFVDVMKFINNYPFPDDGRYVLFAGFNRMPSELALLTNTKMPGKFILYYSMIGINHPRRSQMTEEWVKTVEKAKPLLVIQYKHKGCDDYLPEDFADWVKKNYTFKRNFDNYIALEYTGEKPVEPSAH
jgi:hypothetical protein